jgi:hypothetical protein
MRREEIEQPVLIEDTSPTLAPKPWYEAEGDITEQPWLASATDLLIAWHPEVAIPVGAPQSADWNRYFQDSGVPVQRAAPTPQQTTPTKEPWNTAAASIAVDTLFRFIRAIEAMDVDLAMECVSANYHTMLNDIDVDRDALRLRLDAMVDSWRGPELRIALTEIPDPVFHLNGILIKVVLQVDHRDKGSNSLLTSLLSYVVWFTEDRENSWLIRSLSVVDQVPIA